ncbi:helix-turn-helix domain-containing protein [Candidatus Woesearchaeota archaeon]|nr:helix-turn-helix domain-containing protein [Candidatus Woesearchaeota archaeon]
MELETLFTASKWEILQHLGDQPLSPLQLSECSSTSLANISQQLRLLEMAGLVTSERVPNRDKGQPRILYRLAGDQGYFISTSTDFVEKGLFKLSSYNKIILKIWFYEDANVRYVLEKAFWRIEENLANIKRLTVRKVANKKIELCVIGPKLEPFSITDPEGNDVLVTFTKDTKCKDGHVLYES